MVNCIIIDDEEAAIEVIASHIENISELNLIQTFTNPIEAYNFLQHNNIVQLVFIDVKMPHLNGIKFIDSLRTEKGSEIPNFILTTGYDKYAISGFEQGAHDYLLKPVTLKRLSSSIDRLLEKWKKNNALINKSSEQDFLFINSEGSSLKLKFNDIAYVESERNSTHIFVNKEKKTFYKPIHYIEALLNVNPQFIRVHKSFIVSVNFIQQVNGSDIILNVNGKRKTVSIGATFKENVLKRLKLHVERKKMLI